MEKSRTINSIKNFNIGLILQIVNKVMAFVVRMIFIRILNAEYLGVNGLFTNVLSILSFAELGIGTAIIYNMYKPVAEENHEKIKSLLSLYKKCYNIIGIIIFSVGILLIPFLKYLVKDVPNIKENIIVIYILFLSNTSVSYFFSYKKAIISAYQQERIINRIESVFIFLTSVAQVIFLVLTRNYIVYLIIQISFTLINNIFISYKANKLFPYLKEKNVKELKKEEKKSIFFNVKDLAIYKLGAVILSGTDNIIISALINVTTVGLCSNYTLIIESIRSLLVASLNGVTASIGNLNNSSTTERKISVFYEYNFICFWIYTFCSIAFIILLNPFINLWLGKEYLLNEFIPISLALSFWVCGIRGPAYTYRITLGLFKNGRFAPFLSTIFNIIFSIFLGKKLGVVGIFLATSIAQLLSYSWIDPYIIYKYEFKSKITDYLKKHLGYFIVFAICTFATYYVSSFIKDGSIMMFILKIIVVLFIPNILILIIYFKNGDFANVRNRIFSKRSNK